MKQSPLVDRMLGSEAAPESGWLRAERTEVIDARPVDCLGAILGFDRYPEWQAYVSRVDVLERDKRGRGATVAMFGALGGRERQVTGRYWFPSPNRVCFEQLEGELDAVRGGWLFRGLRGRTQATYTLEIKPGWPRSLLLGGRVYEQLREAVLDHVMGELRDRVERCVSPGAGDPRL